MDRYEEFEEARCGVKISQYAQYSRIQLT